MMFTAMICELVGDTPPDAAGYKKKTIEAYEPFANIVDGSFFAGKHSTNEFS